MGMAAAPMGEYFTRIGATGLPGVLGSAFDAGEIDEDREALAQAERLVADAGGSVESESCRRTHGGGRFGAP